MTRVGLIRKYPVVKVTRPTGHQRPLGWKRVGTLVVVAFALSLGVAPLASGSMRPTRPSPTRHVTAIAASGEATVRFEPPAFNGGYRVTAYSIVVHPTGRRFICRFTHCVVHGLTGGVVYFFTVAAINVAGRGPFSAPSNRIMLRPPATVSVSFLSNGCSGTMPVETENYDTSVALTPNAFTCTGFTFKDWNTASNGSGTTFANNASYPFTRNVTLFAQWTAVLIPANFPGLTAPNWSGYLLSKSIGGYQSVSAQWTVPTLNCSATPGGVSSQWVGVNGARGVYTLFQTGTLTVCWNGGQESYAWWTDQAKNYEGQKVFPVSAGDVISAEVFQQASKHWVYVVKDLTTGLQSTSVEAYSGTGVTAEWILEEPGFTPNGADFADFGSVTFSALNYTVPSNSEAVPPYSSAIEMVIPGRGVAAVPSVIQGSGPSATFTVSYVAPGGA